MGHIIDDFLSDLQIDKSSNFEIRHMNEEETILKSRMYKPTRKVIDFLSDLEVKRFRVAKLLGKHKHTFAKDVQFRMNHLSTKPLSEKTCDFFINYLKEKGFEV